jgi:uncharacterized RDD family membrane protein YckC
MSSVDYAGFWLRVVAFIIDAFVLAAVYLLFIIPVYSLVVTDRFNGLKEVNPEAKVDYFAISTFMSMVSFPQVILFVVMIIYYSIMEASRYQASLGKIALELKVTDVRGAPLTFSKAMIRNVAKIVSSFLLMTGYIVIAFTKKKQALHDFIAGTLVIKK